MRTLIVLAIGVAAAAAFAYGAKAAGQRPGAGALVFTGLWFVFCGVDLGAGVRAGYSAVEELGIHLVLFIVPAAGAWAVARWLAAR